MNEKLYLVYTEVRALYGIGRKQVASLVAAKRLHRIKVGKAWRYPRTDLEMIFNAAPPRRHIRAGYVKRQTAAAV